jgi:hypothetical protein
MSAVIALIPDLPLWLWIVTGIVGGGVLLNVILLAASVTAKIEYHGDFSLKAKYLGITVFDTDEAETYLKFFQSVKGKKPVKASVRSADSEDSEPPPPEEDSEDTEDTEQTPTDSAQKQPPSFMSQIAEQSGFSQLSKDVLKANKRSFDFEVYKLIYDSSKYPVKHIVRKTKITHLRLNCVIASSDAFKTAMIYGFQSAAISGALTWLGSILTLKVKKVSVTADFNKEKAEIDMKCRVKFRVGTVVFCLLKIAVKVIRQIGLRQIIKQLFAYIKQKKAVKKANKRRRKKLKQIKAKNSRR